MKEVHVRVWTCFPPSWGITESLLRKKSNCEECQKERSEIGRLISHMKSMHVSENLKKHKQINKDFQIRCIGLTCETGTHVCSHYGDAGGVLDTVEDSLKVIVMKKCMEGIKFNFKVRLKFIFKFMFKLKDFSKFLCDSCGKRESGSKYLEKYKEIKSNQELSYPGEAWAAGKKKRVSFIFNLNKNLKHFKCSTRHDLELRQARGMRRRFFRVGPGDIPTYSKTSFDSEAGFSGGCLAWVREQYAEQGRQQF